VRHSIPLAADGDAAVLPINVLQNKVADFSTAQAEPSEQQQDCVIPPSDSS
jgi:hypothetical protein